MNSKKKLEVLHITEFGENIPNGIKSVLEQLLPHQKQNIKANMINLRKNKSLSIQNLKSYDLIIFHGIYNLNYLFIVEKLIYDKIPYIIVPHCSLTKISLQQSKLKKKIFNILANRFYKKASAIGFLNKEEEAASILVNKKSIYLPNGVNIPGDITKKNRSGSISIMYLSRIDIYHKGLDLLIESIKLIKDELIFRNVQINIYGDGRKESMEYLYKEIVSNDLSKIIFYKGRVEGEAKDIAFKENDIFILTSRFEGFPMAVLEALSYGLPCILTEGTNMKSMIEKYDSGWISKTEVKDIANTILKGIDKYKYKKDIYNKNTLSNAKDFEWKKVALQHIEIYEDVILRKDKNENTIYK